MMRHAPRFELTKRKINLFDDWMTHHADVALNEKCGSLSRTRCKGYKFGISVKTALFKAPFSSLVRDGKQKRITVLAKF